MPEFVLFQMNGETTCNRCQALAGRLYTPGTEPEVPVHQNCDCSLVPVWIDEGGGGGGGDVDLQEIVNRLDRLEGRMDALEALLLEIQAQLRDLIGQAVRGAAGQVAYFGSADAVIGSTQFTWASGLITTGGDAPGLTANGTDAAVIRAHSHGVNGAQLQAFGSGGDTHWISVEAVNTGGAAGWVRLVAGAGATGLTIKTFNGSVLFEQATTPLATDLATLLSALAAMGLIRTS